MTIGNAMNCDTGKPPSQDIATRVLDSLTEALAVVDSDGTIVITNEAWRVFSVENGGDALRTGVGANYLDVCRSTKGVDVIHAEQAWQGVTDVLNGNREVFTLEYPCHSPSERRWFLLHVSPLKDDPTKVVTVHFSITDRKTVENKLVDSARLAAIGQAMKGLSHKGRHSLQHAQGFLDLLRFSIKKDPDATKLLDRIEIAQRRLVSLYEEVQHYAEPINLRYSFCRLDKIVAEVWASLSPLNDQIKLTHRVKGIDLMCEIDRDAVWHSLKSLFDNAVGNVPATTEVEIAYQTGHLNGLPAITMIISDDGHGIPAVDHEKVFEPFYTTKTIGTGLGLSRVQRIAEAHGGRISVGTSILSGASFYLMFPRRKSIP